MIAPEKVQFTAQNFLFTFRFERTAIAQSRFCPSPSTSNERRNAVHIEEK
jgi:hypothetical protein